MDGLVVLFEEERGLTLSPFGSAKLGKLPLKYLHFYPYCLGYRCVPTLGCGHPVDGFELFWRVFLGRYGPGPSWLGVALDAFEVLLFGHHHLPQ